MSATEVRTGLRSRVRGHGGLTGRRVGKGNVRSRSSPGSSAGERDDRRAGEAKRTFLDDCIFVVEEDAAIGDACADPDTLAVVDVVRPVLQQVADVLRMVSVSRQPREDDRLRREEPVLRTDGAWHRH